MNNKRIIIPLFLTMVFFISSVVPVHASSCDVCFGDGIEVTYEHVEVDCERCNGLGELWQDPVTTDSECSECEDGTVFLKTPCAECGADGPHNFNYCSIC